MGVDTKSQYLSAVESQTPISKDEKSLEEIKALPEITKSVRKMFESGQVSDFKQRCLGLTKVACDKTLLVIVHFSLFHKSVTILSRSTVNNEECPSPRKLLLHMSIFSMYNHVELSGLSSNGVQTPIPLRRRSMQSIP